MQGEQTAPEPAHPEATPQVCQAQEFFRLFSNHQNFLVSF